MASNEALFGDEDSSEEEEMKDEEMKEDAKMKEVDDTNKAAADTNAALFGDDDDSSDEDDKKEGDPKPKKNPLDDDDSSKDGGTNKKGDLQDDSDDEEDALAKKKREHLNKGLFGDDDSSEDEKTDKKPHDAHEDEGDAEFDDKGAVVGSSAPPPPPPPAEKLHATILETTRPTGTLHMTKLPNLIGIQSEAFDEATYSAQQEEAEFGARVHNMIRWRYQQQNGQLLRDPDGKLLRESNTRMVMWEDGSFTLHVGKEALEVETIDSRKGNFAGLNGYLYLSQNATIQEDEQGGGTILECMGPIHSKLVARPSSLQSEAHKSLTVAVRQRTIKKARIAEYVTQHDPEKQKQDRIRTQMDLSKSTARKRRNYQPQRRYTPAMNKRYLEEEEDDGEYDTTNIRGIKRGEMDDMDDYGEDSDDEGTFRRGKPTAARAASRKAAEAEDEEEEELVFEEDSEEESVTLIKASTSKKRKQQAVFEDDSD